MDNPEKRRKQKHNTICVGHRYAQANTNKVNKTWVLLQTTGGKDESGIIYMRKSQRKRKLHIVIDV